MAGTPEGPFSTTGARSTFSPLRAKRCALGAPNLVSIPPMADAAMGAKVPAKNPHSVSDDAAAIDFPMPLDPLVEVAETRRRSAAEEARTIVASTNLGTLASLTSAGDPWASVVTYGQLADGSPVLCVSRLALHGRNLADDQRASLAVSAHVPEGEDPSDIGRVTLAGRVEQPEGEELEAARAAYHSAVESGASFTEWGDFTFWVLRIDQVRWVGGFGRMASTDLERYAEAEADPVAPQAAFAVRHLNEDHANNLLDMAREIAGHTDATAATCLRADRYGLDLDVHTPRGRALARVGFAEPCTAPDGLRAATVELAKRSRGEQ
jgi:putative heme iron utilization protein